MENTPKHPFDYHRPSEGQVHAINHIRANCKTLAAIIESTRMTSREREIAMQKLEEVSMWANKGIILVDEGPVDVGGHAPFHPITFTVNGHMFSARKAVLNFEEFLDGGLGPFDPGSNVFYRRDGTGDYGQLYKGGGISLSEGMEFRVAVDPPDWRTA